MTERIFLSLPDVRQPERDAIMAAIDSGWATPAGPDLAAFDLILPCGLAGARSSSMAALLGRPIDLAEVRPSLLAALGQTLGRRMLEAGPEVLPFAAGARQPAPDVPSAGAPDSAASVGTAK